MSYAQRLEHRHTDSIELVVIHCTELPDLAAARDWGEKILHKESHTGNSGHYYIDRDGGIEQWVPLERVAHHVRSFNQHSVGIELVNYGRYPNWFHSEHQCMKEVYPAAQLQSLTVLLDHLVNILPGLKSIAGHADLDSGILTSEDRDDVVIRRKLDPGPLFPWPEILRATSLKRDFVEKR